MTVPLSCELKILDGFLKKMSTVPVVSVPRSQSRLGSRRRGELDKWDLSKGDQPRTFSRGGTLLSDPLAKSMSAPAISGRVMTPIFPASPEPSGLSVADLLR